MDWDTRKAILIRCTSVAYGVCTHNAMSSHDTARLKLKVDDRIREITPGNLVS